MSRRSRKTITEMGCHFKAAIEDGSLDDDLRTLRMLINDRINATVPMVALKPGELIEITQVGHLPKYLLGSVVRPDEPGTHYASGRYVRGTIVTLARTPRNEKPFGYDLRYEPGSIVWLRHNEYKPLDNSEYDEQFNLIKSRYEETDDV